MTLNQEQTELLNIISYYKTNLKINAIINEELGLPAFTAEQVAQLNNLYSLFVNSLGA